MKYKVILFTCIYISCSSVSLFSQANIDKYRDEIKQVQSKNKLDSLIKVNEKYLLPFDTTRTDTDYYDKASLLANAYYWIRKKNRLLDIVKYLKKLPETEEYYIIKYNAHFLENTAYIFDKDKSDLIKQNNLTMLELARKFNDISAQASALANLIYMIKLNNKDSLLHYTQLLGKIAEAPEQFKVYHNYMGQYFGEINADSAEHHYKKSLTYAIETKDSTGISSAYTRLSDFQSKVGKFEIAIENALKGLSFINANSGSVDFKYINTYVSITEIYKDMEDFSKAEEYIRKASVLAEKNNYKIRNKSIARILGETLFSQKRYNEALIEFLKANAGFENSNNVNERLGALLATAMCYYELEDFEKSNQIINKINLIEIQNFPHIDYRVNLLMGNLNSRQKKYTNAISNFRVSDKIATKLNLKAQAISTAKSLGETYTKMGNYKKANVQFKKAFNLREELFNEDVINSTKKLDAVYQKAEQEKEIIKLNAQNKTNEIVLQQKNKTLTIGGVALLLISILSFVAFALYRNVKSKNGIIASALNEKDILLREIHHRVKNNLQVISSLLSLQSRQIEDEDIKQAINEGRNRVRSMALIHQNLYQKENLTGVSVVEYLNKLTSELFDTYNISEDRIKLNLGIQNIDLDVETMVPLGLIINELVSNSLKHAFPQNKSGSIDVTLEEIDKALLLQIKDNGIGTTQEEMEGSNSFGNRLIKAFSNKLKAKFSVENKNGTLVRLEVKSYKKAS